MTEVPALRRRVQVVPAVTTDLEQIAALHHDVLDRDDPFIEFMRPPPNETPAQMTVRLQREREAQRIHDSIEEDIRNHRARMKRESKVVKVLLLGQAESGAYKLPTI